MSSDVPLRPRPSRYAAFAARLKDVHKALGDPRIPAQRRAELTKRVLAITALSRHDVTVAAHRLEEFFTELAVLAPGAVSGAVSSPEGTPFGKNTATQG
ncbi:hypothetical protein KGQ20_01560 [Catenulispora sp. NF23]|uniref:Uncharacterized protein n=1 Tax=Catenulispora pinistramenti TaxID=2705254 RepID=A0ABS5KLV0_9ACTN|nr:hypothetical protein [Catenulispora pinistramenti]MBS2531449.1 hypothetical protein [Catenulispora pinistramenti]MBS2547013.1 hypothetical protein [Catenulispora pinistramenti]